MKIPKIIKDVFKRNKKEITSKKLPLKIKVLSLDLMDDNLSEKYREVAAKALDNFISINFNKLPYVVEADEYTLVNDSSGQSYKIFFSNNIILRKNSGKNDKRQQVVVEAVLDHLLQEGGQGQIFDVATFHLIRDENKYATNFLKKERRLKSTEQKLSNERVVKVGKSEAGGEKAFENEYHYLTQFHNKELKPKVVVKSNSNTYYLLMRKMQADLQDYLEIHHQDLSSQQLLTLTLSMVYQVEDNHENEVSHLDIKPENFLLDDQCNIVLADYGHARSVLNPSTKLAGTETFVDPEILLTRYFLGEELQQSKTDDVYSLGLVLAFLFGNVHPEDIVDEVNNLAFKADEYLNLSKQEKKNINPEEIFDEKQQELMTKISMLSAPLQEKLQKNQPALKLLCRCHLMQYFWEENSEYCKIFPEGHELNDKILDVIGGMLSPRSNRLDINAVAEQFEAIQEKLLSEHNDEESTEKESSSAFGLLSVIDYVQNGKGLDQIKTDSPSPNNSQTSTHTLHDLVFAESDEEKEVLQAFKPYYSEEPEKNSAFNYPDNYPDNFFARQTKDKLSSQKTDISVSSSSSNNSSRTPSLTSS